MADEKNPRGAAALSLGIHDSTASIPTLSPASQGGRKAPLRSPFRRRIAVAAATVAFLAAASAGWAQDDLLENPRDDRGLMPAAPSLRKENAGYGPLRIASQSPFQSLRLRAPVEPASSLAAGHWEIRETTTWSRMWAQSEEYLLSFETLSTTQSMVYAAAPGLLLELGTVGGSRFGGGELDGFVRGFHDLVGLGQGGRNLYPRGEYHFEVKGTSIEESRNRSSTEYLFFSVHHTLSDGTETLPAVAWSFSLKTGLVDVPELTGGTIESALSVTLSKHWDDFYGYLSMGVVWYGAEQLVDLDLRSLGASVMAAVEWNLLPGVSLVGQYLWSLGSVEDAGLLSRATHELGLGFKIEIVEGTVLEVGATENIVVFDNTPDFGIHGGLSVRF